MAARELVEGERVGVAASTVEANAAMRTIRGREDGESDRGMLARMAKESGVPAQPRPSGRTRKGKRVSIAGWVSPSDPDTKITRSKDGRTRPRRHRWLVSRARGVPRARIRGGAGARKQ